MEYKVQIIPESLWNRKCPHTIKPKYITVHNTYNRASAEQEVAYLKSNQAATSCHIFVDETEAIQCLPLDRNGWHAGDGVNGMGNRDSIGVEICRSTDYETDRFNVAFQNGAKVVGKLMRQFNIPIERVVQHNHWTGKNCPHRIRAEGTWQEFLDLCEKEYLEGVDTMSYDIKVVRIPREKNREYLCSVDGNKYGQKYDVTSLNGFGDTALEKDGWAEEVCINGSIFYSWDGKHYAEGLEKSRGVNNQEFELSCVSDFAETMAIGFRYDGSVDFEKQKLIQANIDQYYGAVTGAFGIMKHGERCEWGKELEARRNRLYSQRAGRTIFGYDSENNQYVILSIAGVTGQSGPTGSELYGICRKHGLTDAINLDGSGSRKLRWKGKVIVDGSRLVKNAVLIYSREKKEPVPEPEPKPEPKPETKPEPAENQMFINVDKVGLYIREKLEFKGKKPAGQVLTTIPVGKKAKLIRMIHGIQPDGYQWCETEYCGIHGFSQYDSQCYWLENVDSQKGDAA